MLAPRRPPLRPGPRAGRAVAARASAASPTPLAAAADALRAAAAAVPDAGIYGSTTPLRAAVVEAVEAAEAATPPGAAPTAALADLDGVWRVLYSTVSITGSKRVRLGLKSAVHVREVTQTLDAATATAVNEVRFVLTFLGSRPGSLRLEATFAPASPTRVSIELSTAKLHPPQLDALLASHMELLLSIFNPQGWLDTTFVGGGVRVGRDDKGNIFILERVAEAEGESAAAAA